MNWTKIPTNLLIDRTPDNEMIAIVKYQLLWAELEYQPTDETALRYMTSKQLALVKHWLNTIETQVVADIKSANTNRTKRKLNYTKNKGLKEIVTDTLPDTVTNTITDTVSYKDKIRLNNILNNIDKENNIGGMGEKERKRFIKPTLEEIQAYCKERSNTVNPERFMDYYESNGWRVGKNPMKDWKAAIRTWEKTTVQQSNQQEQDGFHGI